MNNQELFNNFLDFCRSENINLNPWQDRTAQRVLNFGDPVIMPPPGRQTGKSTLASLLQRFRAERFTIVTPTYTRAYSINEFYPGTNAITPNEIHGRRFDSLIIDDADEIEFSLIFLRSLCNQLIVFDSIHNPIEYTREFATVKKEEREWDE